MLTPEDFEPWVGRQVRINTVPAPIEAVLARIVRMPVRIGAHREPFSLMFETPDSIFLLDATYEFDCGRGGPHEIFISQLKPADGRRVYEAVFN